MLEMEKFAATGRLAGTIAHEINNPMEAIKNAIFLLRNKVEPDSQQVYDALKSETDRVTRIVRQMLGLYRNAGHLATFDLNAIAEDTLTLFSRPLAKDGITVEKQFARPVKKITLAGIHARGGFVLILRLDEFLFFFFDFGKEVMQFRRVF